MTTPTTTNETRCADCGAGYTKIGCRCKQAPLDVKTVREMRDQLISCQVKPYPANQGVFFLVTTKGNVRRVLKALGFTQKEIRAIIKKVTK